eukprot:PITA_13395
MASSGKIEIEKFNGQSFELWKLKMEDLLVDKDQWIAVDPGTKPTGVTDEEWKKLDRKAKSTIRLCVSDSVLLNVSGKLRRRLCGTNSWDSLVIAIGSNANALQFDEIVSALLTEEMRRKNMDNQNGDALSVRGWSQNRNKNKSSSRRSKSRGRYKSPGKPTKVVCWKCGKEGNFRRECKSKAPDKGKGFDDAPSKEAKTTLNEGGDVYLASSSTHVDHEAWLIDSGASFHFTPHREWFCEYEKYNGGDVFLGDNQKARIIGCGKVKLKLQGVKTVFEKDTCKMVRGALVLMRGVQIGTLYKLQGSTVIDGCNSSMVPENGAENLVVSGENTMMWHQRIGHIGEKGLRILYGKDDFSRNTWIYFLKKKSEVFDRFKEFKAQVENQTEKKIKVLRTDNGGELCSKEFEEFCKKCGIARQKTTPYTPQQNGVAERMNKTLMKGQEACSVVSG